MKASVNIGLNVGTNEPKNQLVDTLSALNKLLTFVGAKLDNHKIVNDSLYIEQKERTFVAYFDIDLINIDIVLSDLSKELNQECIAYKVNGIGYIAFNPDYKGEKFPFNQEYYHD